MKRNFEKIVRTQSTLLPAAHGSHKNLRISARLPSHIRNIKANNEAAEEKRSTKTHIAQHIAYMK